MNEKLIEIVDAAVEEFKRAHPIFARSYEVLHEVRRMAETVANQAYARGKEAV